MHAKTIPNEVCREENLKLRLINFDDASLEGESLRLIRMDKLAQSGETISFWKHFTNLGNSFSNKFGEL
jgi:hypothetical protein